MGHRHYEELGQTQLHFAPIISGPSSRIAVDLF
jgi:hypothetical protein